MKKFLIKLSYTVLPLWLAVLALVCYVTLYISPKISGDLGRLAYIPFGQEYDRMIEAQAMTDTLFTTIRQTEQLRTLHVDVLTVGDSFSQQANGGYQNYLPGRGLTVANCFRKLYASPLQYASNLLDQGVIDSTNVKVLLVEIAERDFLSCFQEFREDKVEVPSPATGEKVSNEWSLMRSRDFVLYRIGYDCPVYTAQLDRDYFTSDEPRKLYFYYADVDNGVNIGQQNEAQVKAVFDLMCRKAASRGVFFMLMVAVDKYDVYQTHIVGNAYPAKTVNEELTQMLGQSPSLFLCKPYLKPLVDQGEKDVFLFNNTHWTPKASEAIGNALSDRLSEVLP